VITRIIEMTGDLSVAQLIAGHADVRTTQGYIHLGDEHPWEIHRISGADAPAFRPGEEAPHLAFKIGLVPDTFL
jgi:hypothetical protein